MLFPFNIRCGRGSRYVQDDKNAFVGRMAAPVQVFKRCVEDYDPQNAEDFQEGPPLSGFRNLTECIRQGPRGL